MKVLASVLIAVGCLFAVPSTALAVTYTVDSTLDEADASPGVGGCLTAGAKCTLRAAIEESNTSTSVKDTIDFTAAFDGQLADTIAITLGAFPIIADEVTIDGDEGTPCTTAALLAGPCVGVSGSAGLDVNSDDVEIKGLAVIEAGTGINVINGSSGFTATNNWIGVKLDGSAGANTTGIFIDPDSNGASIGGNLPADRNVIANSTNEGLDIEGADDAVVRGNYFGVNPAGTAQAANAKDIEITDSTAGGGFEATDNEIGRTIEGAAVTTTACDGGCNVISGAIGTGIDLNGSGANEAPASGPTTVHGNYVGLNAAGTAVITNGQFNVLAGAADEATIGGLEGEEANFIAGGGFGIYHENGEDFQALGNVIGFGATGAAVTPPSEAGIFAFSLAVTEPATIVGNAIRMSGGVGIEQRFLGATIAENFVEGPTTGIWTLGSTGGAGNSIEGNLVEGTAGNALLIENEGNSVVGNLLEGAGEAAISIQGIFGSGNTIGGDTEFEENAIFGSGDDAIEVVDPEDTENQVKRNFGAANGGLFIDLGANGGGNSVSGPNGGIQEPTIDSAKLGAATGSGALPGATIRVFRKATTESGEILSFLGEAVADGSGNWSVAYAAPIPGETRIAATQTSGDGTSELDFATTEPALPPSGGGSAADADVQSPQTKITKGPKAKTRATTVKFKFTSSETGSTFECKLDKKPFKPCKSPKKYKKLKPGKHVFKVRATDKAGNVDPTPAKKKFKVLG